VSRHTEYTVNVLRTAWYAEGEEHAAFGGVEEVAERCLRAIIYAQEVVGA
jgi:hypothetical protein